MSIHTPAFIPVLPLCAALLSPLFSKLNKNAGKWLVIAAIGGSFYSALLTLIRVLSTGETIHYWMGNWAPPLGIEFVIDPLNGVLAVLVTFVSLMVSIYGIPFHQDGSWLRIGGYYSLFALLTAGLVGMTVTGDVFNLYVFLEISSLSGYGLISMGGKKSTLAAFRYLLIGTIGASFYLLGVGYLYAMTGTLNMADLAVRIAENLDSPLFILVTVMFVVGFGIKMALFPLHGWQPDAYTYAHPAAAPLISGIMSKIPAYAMLRFFFYIFGVQNAVVEKALIILGVLGAFGIILGSVMAIAQTDFRRICAYSSVAQIGYIAVGIAIGNLYGLIGAVLHIINHAFMKSALFLVAGAFQYRLGTTDIRQFGQVCKKMPVSVTTFVIAAMAMVGVPPTGGFFSKWYIMLGAAESEMYAFIAVLVVSSLLNAIYFFKVIENIFISKENTPEEINPPKGRLELPLQMLIPIIVMGLGILALGFMNAEIVNGILKAGLMEVIL